MGVSKSLTFALQALLARHEAYMADAERDRRELTSRIEQLEMDNKELEARNAKTIEENRNLLDQLEALNTAVNDSEGHIKALEATLLSSQQTIRRLEGETARAESLERQVVLLEQEQADLQNNLSLSRDEARSAMFRWKRAEREINDLQEQLERIEQEARTEREHHVEMMGRIERQREMEKELNSAAIRLKGAAAVKSLNYAKNGTTVVSHFVRDLLQDNANLQHGIAELREMLLNSHDEIQALRDQMAYHQPLGDAEASTLRAELESGDARTEYSPRVSQELHIHHHYHVSKPDLKKPRRKRLGLVPGLFEPSTGSYPATPPSLSTRPSPLSHSRGESHWSIVSDQPSEFAPSSAPSSPQSNRRTSSLFDTVQSPFPPSPTTSVDPMSPTWRGSHRKQLSSVSSRGFQAPTSFPAATQLNQTHSIIEETDDAEHVPGLTPIITTTHESTADELRFRDRGIPNRNVSIFNSRDEDHTRSPRLHKRVSQESIISLSGGLDIHTLKSRPSQLTLRPYSTSSSVVASSIVTARPMLSRNSARRSSVILRHSYASSPASSSTRSIPAPTMQPGTSKLEKWIGWRPWGGGGANRGTAGDTASGGQAGGQARAKTTRDTAHHKQVDRPPGINQRGPIPGFAEYVAASVKRLPPPKILPDVVDQEALREGLGE